MKLTNLTPGELRTYFEELALPGFRADQLLKWVYQKSVFEYTSMTNLPKDLQTVLNRELDILSISLDCKTIAEDGTTKYAFTLQDGSLIESVLIPMETEKFTFCISSQVGCAMNCGFCNTARMGFVRNLLPSEIVSQVLYLRKAAELTEKQAFNIVFMGMGEPLLNYANVQKAIDIMVDPGTMNLSPRRITISTCGIIDGIRKLARTPHPPRIAISLNAADADTRAKIMPVSITNPLSDLLSELKQFPLARRERFTFEYVLIRNFNDSEKDARNLVRLLNGLRYKINLIPFNPFEGSMYQPATPDRVTAFRQVLLNKGVTAVIRKSKGAGIKAACGQLVSRIKQKKPGTPGC